MELFFNLLGLLLLGFPIIAIVALVKSVGLGEHLRRLEARLAAVERSVPTPTAAVPKPPRPAPTHIPPAAEPIPPTSEPEKPAEPAPPPPEREPAIAATSPIAPPLQVAPSPPTAPPPPSMSLEERLGAQWAVWVGGLALVLGGIFLVRYSIEQGLLGPPVRVTLGALLAIALISAGEWARVPARP